MSHVLISHDFLSQSKFVLLPWDRADMCLRPASKHLQNTSRNSVLQANRLEYVAYEVMISCKGPLRATLYVYCYFENQFYVFQTAPVVVYRLMKSVFSTSQHRCYWLSPCLCKHFTIWRMTQYIVKTSCGIELWSQFSDRNSKYDRKLHKFARFHLPTLGICNAYLNIRHVDGNFFLIGQIFSNRESSELIGTCRGKLGKKLAINHFMLKTFICFKNLKIFYFTYLKCSLLKIDHCDLQISHGTIYFRFYWQLEEFIWQLVFSFLALLAL